MDLKVTLVILILILMFYFGYLNNDTFIVKKNNLKIKHLYDGDVNMDNKNYYKLNLIRKDTMGGDFKDEYLHYYDNDLEKPYTAWSDDKSYGSPNYYKRAFNGYKIGSEIHYDNANRLFVNSDKVKNPVKRYPNNKCYIDVNGVNVCDFYGTDKKVPFSLFNVNDNGNSVYQPIISEGVDTVSNELHKTLNYKNDKVKNGAPFYKKNNLIYGGSEKNENPRANVNEQVIIFD